MWENSLNLVCLLITKLSKLHVNELKLTTNPKSYGYPKQEGKRKKSEA